MNRELAEHISLLAAPIFATMLTDFLEDSRRSEYVASDSMELLRRHAIHQAHLLWLQTLDTEP